MAQTVGDFLVERLHQWGVRILFGYPGDSINGVFGALNRADNWEQRVMEGDPKIQSSTRRRISRTYRIIGSQS